MVSYFIICRQVLAYVFFSNLSEQIFLGGIVCSALNELWKFPLELQALKLWCAWSVIIGNFHYLYFWNVLILPLDLLENLVFAVFERVIRGVRSDTQLSCTETRFQKCSQSGNIGSKHPMLSIPMAYNVFSCKKNRKKHSKNQTGWFDWQVQCFFRKPL